MSRPSKDGVYLNIKLRGDIDKLLRRHCELTGQTKTMATERALLAYCTPKQTANKALTDDSTT